MVLAIVEKWNRGRAGGSAFSVALLMLGHGHMEIRLVAGIFIPFGPKFGKLSNAP